MCNDDVLRELIVAGVEPGPDESRLLVTVVPSLPGPFDAAAAQQHLERSAGKLRTEVAAAIHRKKTPQLVFRVVATALWLVEDSPR